MDRMCCLKRPFDGGLQFDQTDCLLRLPPNRRGCTEILSGGERILIDLGANLLDTNGLISDDELLFFKVFDGRPVNGLLLYASP